MIRIGAVLFDLDGTLLDRRKTFQQHLELQVSRNPWCFTHDSAGRYITELLALDENGMCDRETFYVQAERRCQLAFGAAEALQADFEANFPESCVPFPGVLETLDILRATDLKLGIITNGRVLIQGRKIDGLGIRPFLDCVVISEAAGVSKPDPRIFARALGELNSSPSAAVFVGDNPDTDVIGAKRSGLVAVWKRDTFWNEPPEADFVIDELAELPRQLSLLTTRSSA